MSYKIVKELYKDTSYVQLYSCRITSRPLIVIYKLNKWIKPPHGPSLVFDTITNAREFSIRHNGSTDVIYSCRTKRRRRIVEILMLTTDLETDLIREFWDASLPTLEQTVQAPPGTYAADEVMLTKRIGLSIKW